MSTHFHELKPGDTLDIKGPLKKLQIEPNMKKKIGMIAGGTGITPMLQVRLLDTEIFPSDRFHTPTQQKKHDTCQTYLESSYNCRY
jgi:ferredoxin-NADP reductase